MEEKMCPQCQEPMFEVFFNTDKMYTDVKYMRCMSCNKIEVEKVETKGEQQ